VQPQGELVDGQPRAHPEPDVEQPPPGLHVDRDGQVAGDQHQENARHEVMHVHATYVHVAGDTPSPVNRMRRETGERDGYQEGAEDQHLRLSAGQDDPLMPELCDVVPEAVAGGVNGRDRAGQRIGPSGSHVPPSLSMALSA
jgi:hypothetical protein